MLVLTRKIGEQIIIGDNVRVTVVSVGPGRVKIGIEAPPSVSVDRQEVYEKKRDERPVGPPAPTATEADAPVLYNRIAGLAPVEQTPAPVAVAAVSSNPTPAVIRARLNRKPR